MSALLAAVLLWVSAAHAADAGWRQATLKDVEKSADYAQRAKHPAGYLSARADFNGDGTEDEVAFFISADDKTYALFVVPPGRKPSQKVAEGPIAEFPRVGVFAGRAGVYQTACKHGDERKPNCKADAFTTPYPTMHLFSFQSGARVIYWDGRAFVTQAISD